MNYSEFVRSRFKSGEKIAAEMTPHKAALQVLGVDRSYIEAMNQAKLSKRYEAGYSDQQAQERKDKQ